MASTPQTQALNVANTLVSIAQQLISVYGQMDVLDAAWTDNAIATVLGTLGTIALNPDGSLGAQDSTPNPNHSLNPNLYPTLTRALSSTQLTQIKSICDAVVSLLNGNAVTAQGGARAILNQAVG